MFGTYQYMFGTVTYHYTFGTVTYHYSFGTVTYHYLFGTVHLSLFGTVTYRSVPLPSDMLHYRILSSSTRDRCSIYGTTRIYSTPVQVYPRHCSTGYSAGIRSVDVYLSTSFGTVTYHNRSVPLPINIVRYRYLSESFGTVTYHYSFGTVTYQHR
jgi:hypothetical protein